MNSLFVFQPVKENFVDKAGVLQLEPFAERKRANDLKRRTFPSKTV